MSESSVMVMGVSGTDVGGRKMLGITVPRNLRRVSGSTEFEIYLKANTKYLRKVGNLGRGSQNTVPNVSKPNA